MKAKPNARYRRNLETEASGEGAQSDDQKVTLFESFELVNLKRRIDEQVD